MRARVIKKAAQQTLPSGLFEFLLKNYRRFRHIIRIEDISASIRFLRNKDTEVSFLTKLRLLGAFYRASWNIYCPHTQNEIIAFVTQMLRLGRSGDGVFVEAGCFLGGSSAKFSLAARTVGKKLLIFDSFHGIPPTTEPNFSEGEWCGSLREVKANIDRYGAIDHCEFIEGWFEDTMPHFKGKILGAYLDVDLASSTKTCLIYLYPQIQTGGVLLSQDAHLVPVCTVFEDDEFWRSQVGVNKPRIRRLTKKLIIINKNHLH